VVKSEWRITIDEKPTKFCNSCVEKQKHRTNEMNIKINRDEKKKNDPDFSVGYIGSIIIACRQLQEERQQHTFASLQYYY
jgi:hypothetical protein